MGLTKLRRASDILVSSLIEHYQSVELRENRYELLMTFKIGIRLYVRYNNFGEYGYNIIFSSIKYDRIRFDNFDDRWQVSTKPHHKHVRRTKNVVDSPMVGYPDQDMIHLVNEIKQFLV